MKKKLFLILTVMLVIALAMVGCDGLPFGNASASPSATATSSPSVTVSPSPSSAPLCQYGHNFGYWQEYTSSDTYCEQKQYFRHIIIT